MSDLSLLPCPFCGGAASLKECIGDEDDDELFYWVEHSGFDAEECPIKIGDFEFERGMETHAFDSAEEAVASWNKRAA